MKKVILPINGRTLVLRCIMLLLLVTMKIGRTQAQALIPGMDAVTTLYADEYLKPVAMVKRVGDPLGVSYPPAAPPGTNNWVPPAIVPAVTNWTAETMGQVFGTTIDATGYVYFAATAMYYYVAPQIYPNPQRLAAATVPAANVSLNGFHSVTTMTGHEIGLVYKAANSGLNTVSCIVTSENNGTSTPGTSGLNTTRLPNTGYGIGNIAIAKTYNKLYASNLEDGRLYCINPATGNVDGVFDPLAPDNGTSGIAPLGERIFAVGVNNEFDGTVRLYYSLLLSTNKSVIRSVQLTAGGTFLPLTDVLEIDLPQSGANTFVSDIAFSIRGELLVAEKGNPHDGHVYQYYGHHNAWSVPQDLPVSDFSNFRNSGGGVDYGFMKKNVDTTVCDSLIWTMENAMDTVKWYGMQSIPHNGYTVIVPPAPFPNNQAYVVDLDTIPGASVKGRFGDIVFYDGQCPGGGPTDICGLVSATLVRDSCCYNIYVSNKYHGQYFTGLTIETGHLNIDNVIAGTTWGGITYRADQSVSFGDTAKLWYMPKDIPSPGGGGFFLAKICMAGTGNDILKIRWIGNAPQFDTVCEKDVPIQPCGVPVDTNCVGIINHKAICDNGIVSMQFQVKNNSSFTMRSVTIHSLNPNAKPTNSFFPIADLPPGATSPVYTVPLTIKNNDTTGCFFFSACDLNVFPGTSGQYPKYCCMDSIQYCITIPSCDPCDAITLSAEKTDPTNCCYKLTLSNNYTGSPLKCMRFKGHDGAQFAVFSGWNIQAPVSSNNITICAPGGAIGNGTFPEFANFCITGTSKPPYTISVEFLDNAGNVICTKQLEFDSCKLVDPTCANIVDDSLYCDGNKTQFSFHIKNNSTFTLYQVDLRLSDTSFKLDKYVIQPNPPIQPGATAGPYLLTVIDTASTGTNNFCLYLTGHNNIYIPDSISATQCCTDSMQVICLPFINCDSTVIIDTNGNGGDTTMNACCQFDDLTIPNGITPNNDGFNDAFIIANTNKCKNISIVVYNRWGNIVFKDPHYMNTWKGENTHGEILPQGTYFIVVTLDSGAQKGLYVDIRY